MQAILIYGFPLILIGFEWGLRHLLQIDSQGFMGPTLAAAGLTILVPLTKPKLIGPVNKGSKTMTVNANDQQLIAFVWLVVLAALFAWSAACYFSVTAATLAFVDLPTHVAIGLCCYLTSILLVAVKEAV